MKEWYGSREFLSCQLPVSEGEGGAAGTYLFEIYNAVVEYGMHGMPKVLTLEQFSNILKFPITYL